MLDRPYNRLSIEYRPTSQLNPRASNARTHSKKQIAQIAAAIRRFGFNNPVLVDDDNGIIAGHGRVEAAKRVGLSEVPTVQLSDLSEADAAPTSSPTKACRETPAGIASCSV